MKHVNHKCSRNVQYIIAVAITSCMITGYIYQFLYGSLLTYTDSNLQIITIKQTDESLTEPNDNSALDMVAKYYSRNVMNKNKYSTDDFSFFWTQGDGSPLFINSSKYNKIKGYKSFVFCPIPKVGCSSWKQVIKRIKGIDIYLADDYWSLHDPKSNELFQDRLHNIGVNGANTLLLNENTSPFHAVFVRDPIARALSAWLDKCIASYWTGKYWCQPSTFKSKILNKYIYSQFDIFVENIINKPIVRNTSKHRDRPHMQAWAIDFHWLPQNFICDIYKFIDKYHIYYAENVTHRKQFLLDIGGENLWNKIGSNGWIKRNKTATFNITVIKHLQDLNALYINITKFRDNPAIISGNMVSGINVSLLESKSFHQSNANAQIRAYYRSDILAKVIAYYEDDYILFKMRIPNIICDYLNYDLLKKLMQIIGDHNVEQSLRTRTRNIFNGYNSIYVSDANYKGNKTLYTVHDDDESKTYIWNRDKYIFDMNLDTKIPYLYDMMDVDDIIDEYTFGIRLSGIRGMMTLINIISVVDPHTWPKNKQCFNLKMNEWNVEDTIRNELRQFVDVLHEYFVNILPMVIGEFSNDRNMTKYIENKIQLWSNQKDIKKIDIPALIVKWIDEDNILYGNIKSWLLYQRDVPRQLYNAKKYNRHR